MASGVGGEGVRETLSALPVGAGRGQVGGWPRTFCGRKDAGMLEDSLHPTHPLETKWI